MLIRKVGILPLAFTENDGGGEFDKNRGFEEKKRLIVLSRFVEKRWNCKRYCWEIASEG